MHYTYLFTLLSFCIMIMSSCTDPKKTEQTMLNKNVIPVVIGTYTRKEGHVDGKAAGIYIYELDTVTGILSYMSTAKGIINPSYVAANNSTVLASSEVSPGEIALYQYNSDSSELQEKFRTSSYGDYPCHVSISADNEYVFVANYGTGSIAAYLIKNKELVFLDSVRHSGKGLTSRQESAHAHMVTTDPKNPKLIYGVDLGTDKIYAYELIDQKLELRYQIAMNPGSGPRQLVFHPIKPFAYVLNELSGSVTLLKKNDNDEYEFNEEYMMLDSVNFNDAGGADIQITPNGKFVYASIRGGANKIIQFEVGEEGFLSTIGTISSGGKTPRAIKLDPSGKFLFSLNQDSDNIVTYRIAESGGLDSLFNTQVLTPVSMDFIQ